LKSEVFYGENLRARFGGGYKVVYFNGQKFLSVPSVTFLFMRLDETVKNQEIGLIEMNRLLKFHQNNEVMETLVSYLGENKISNNENNEAELSPYRMHYTFPITVEPGDQFILNSNLTYQSQYYCLSSDIRLVDRFPYPFENEYPIISLIRVIGDDKKDEFLQIDDNPESVQRLTLKNGYFQWLFSTMRALDREKVLASLLSNLS
jgi:hypothetical protein